MRSSKGYRRLAVLAGGASAIGWILFVVVFIQFFPTLWVKFYPFSYLYPDMLVGSALMFFLIPFLLVHAVAWVIRGFQEDREKDTDA